MAYAGRKSKKRNKLDWLSEPPDEDNKLHVPKTSRWRERNKLNSTATVSVTDAEQSQDKVVPDFVKAFFDELSNGEDSTKTPEKDMTSCTDGNNLDNISHVCEAEGPTLSSPDMSDMMVDDEREFEISYDMLEPPDADDTEINVIEENDAIDHTQEEETILEQDESGRDGDEDLGSDADEDGVPAEEDEAPAEEDNQPLYHGARISFGTHMLLVMAFVVRHGLSGAAVLDLLTLIEIHCALHNLCKTSLRLFQQYFETNLNVPIQKHHFCGNCKAYFGTREKERCEACGRQQDKKSPSYFFISPLAESLQSLFKRK